MIWSRSLFVEGKKVPSGGVDGGESCPFRGKFLTGVPLDQTQGFKKRNQKAFLKRKKVRMAVFSEKNA